MSQPQTYYLEEWHAAAGLPGDAPDRVVSIADGSGNLYVAGPTLNVNNHYDLLLTKYDDDGDELWSETFNLVDTSANVIVGQIALDGTGAPIVTGAVYNGNTNDYDAFTVKHNTSGVYQWHALYNGSGSHYDGGADLFCDSSNNIYIAGGTTDDTDLMDFLIIAYEPDGDVIWTQTLDGNGLFDAAGHIYQRSSTQLNVVGVVQEDLNTWALGQRYYYLSSGSAVSSLSTYGQTDLEEIRDIAVDGDDNIYVTGYADNGATGYDIVTAKLNSSLELQWSYTYNDPNNLDDESQALAVDASGNVYVAGYATKPGEGKNFLVLKYNSSGAFQWNNSRNGLVDTDDEAFDIAVDTNGLVYVTGYITEEGNKDYFVQILNSAGSSQWEGRFNGIYNGDDKSKKLVVEESGRISLTGKTGTPEGFTYTTVRYTPKELLLPPDSEAASQAIYFTENRGQVLDTEEEQAKQVKFYCDRSGPALFFQDDRVSFVTARIDGNPETDDTLHRVDMRFYQSKGAERIYGLERREQFNNYYLGHIPEGREKVGLYDRLVHTDAFDDIDVQYYSNGAGVKYYIVVKPGADPADIALLFSGYNSLGVSSGDLVIGTDAGDIVLPQPEAFLVDNSGTPSSVGWTPTYSVTDSIVSLTFSSYDDAKTLVFRIKDDPPTSPSSENDWVTYYGGMSFDYAYDLVVEEEGVFYITGYTSDMTGFPEGSFNVILGGGGKSDAFVSKIDEIGKVAWTTYVGGNGQESGLAIDLYHNSSSIAIAGRTTSDDFPNAGIAPSSGTEYDGFIMKLVSEFGLFESARYLGGNGFDEIYDIKISNDDNVYVVGRTKSTNILATQENGSSYYQTALAEAGKDDGIIYKLSEDLEDTWVSYFGGEGKDAIMAIAINPDNQHILVAGETYSDVAASENVGNTPCGVPGDGSFPDCDPGGVYHQLWGGGDPLSVGDAFVAEFSATGQLVWSTYLGGEGDESDHNFLKKISIAIAPENPDMFCVMGRTDDISDFPLFSTAGEYIQSTGKGNFIVRFIDRNISWSSGFGCADEFYGATAITIDENENIYVAGITDCTTPSDPEDYCDVPDAGLFPICHPEGVFFQADSEGNPIPGYISLYDSYLAAFNSLNELIWSTYFGGMSFDDIFAIEYSSNTQKLYLTGGTDSQTNFPLRDPDQGNYQQNQSFGQVDAFVGRLSMQQLVVGTHQESKPSETLRIYPNPSNGSFYLHFLDTEESTLYIYASNGECMRKQSVSVVGGDVLVDMSGLVPGIYFIQMINSQGCVSAKLIIH